MYSCSLQVARCRGHCRRRRREKRVLRRRTCASRTRGGGATAAEEGSGRVKGRGGEGNGCARVRRDARAGVGKATSASERATDGTRGGR